MSDSNNSFDGTFDGGGFIIRNLTIDRNEDYVGLFGYNTGTIVNVTLEDVSINANNGSSVGGLVGYNIGTIDNVSFSGDVEGTNNIGGLVGHNYTGTIENSSFSGNVSGNINIGGFVGRNYNGTYSGNSYCQQDVLLPAVGNGGSISGIVTLYLYKYCGSVASS